MSKIPVDSREDNIKLGPLVLLLDSIRQGELTDRQRDWIYKAFSRLDALLPVAGHTTVITETTILRMLPNKIWRWPADGSNIVVYDLSTAGILDALGSCVVGDKLVIPQDITVDDDLAVPDSVHVMGLGKKHVTLTLRGTGEDSAITLGESAVISDISLLTTKTNYTSFIATSPDGALENVRIDYNVNDTTFHHVLNNPSSGKFYIRKCEIETTQDGSGHLAVVRIESNTGDIIVKNSNLFSTSTSGQGYIVHKFDPATSGIVRWQGGRGYASYKPVNH